MSCPRRRMSVNRRRQTMRRIKNQITEIDMRLRRPLTALPKICSEEFITKEGGGVTRRNANLNKQAKALIAVLSRNCLKDIQKCGRQSNAPRSSASSAARCRALRTGANRSVSEGKEYQTKIAAQTNILLTFRDNIHHDTHTTADRFS